MLQKLAKSLLLVIGMALCAAWPLTYVGINFYSSLVFFTVLQFVGFYFYGEYQSRKLAIEEQKLLLAAEAELSKQGAEVVCPCDRQVRCFVPITINDRNEYKCPGCNKDVNVLVKLKTALITRPVLDAPSEAIIKNLDELGN